LKKRDWVDGRIRLKGERFLGTNHEKNKGDNEGRKEA